MINLVKFYPVELFRSPTIRFVCHYSSRVAREVVDLPLTTADMAQGDAKQTVPYKFNLHFRHFDFSTR